MRTGFTVPFSADDAIFSMTCSVWNGGHVMRASMSARLELLRAWAEAADVNLPLNY
jgi:hypothetical protein